MPEWIEPINCTARNANRDRPGAGGGDAPGAATHLVTQLPPPSNDDDDEMAARYVAAIGRSREDAALGLRLANGAAERIEGMFNAQTHYEAIRELLFRDARGCREIATMSALTGQPVEASEVAARVEDDGARQRALLELLQARNSELRKTLQVERERFVATEALPRHDGRKMPAKLFRRLAKASGGPTNAGSCASRSGSSAPAFDGERGAPGC